MSNSSQAKVRNLTSGPIASTLLTFAFPVLGSSILQSLNTSINAAWVGHFLGETGLAATANVSMMMFLVFALIFGFGTANTIIIGQNMGRRDLDGARKAVASGVSLFAVLGVLVTLLGWVGAPALLRALNTPDDVLPSALIYLRTMFLGLGPSLMTVFFAMALRGTGDSLTPLLLMVPGMIVDIGLNPVLIAGVGPLPPLGIMGSGLATVIANTVSMLLMLIVIYARDLPVRLRGPEFRYLIPSAFLIGRILRMGIPMGLQAIVVAGSSLVMLELINHQGTSTVAAFGATNQLWAYVQMPGMSIGLAVSTMAAQNIGGGHWDRVDRIAWAGIALSGAMTAILLILTIPLGHTLLAAFLPGNPKAIAIAEHINLLAGWTFVLQAISMVLSSVTRANGATLVPLVIMAVAFVPGRLGAAYGLAPAWGANAIWLSFPVGGLALLALTALYYAFGGWREVRLVPAAADRQAARAE